MWIRDSGCYRKIQTIKDHHKLSPILEGPFEVIEVTQPGLSLAHIDYSGKMAQKFQTPGTLINYDIFM
jgi:hypothetical protein